MSETVLVKVKMVKVLVNRLRANAAARGMNLPTYLGRVVFLGITLEEEMERGNRVFYGENLDYLTEIYHPDQKKRK